LDLLDILVLAGHLARTVETVGECPSVR